MITLCFPTIRRFDTLVDAIQSARKGTVKPDKIVVLDNSGGGCPKIEGADIRTAGYNKGVAGSWNYFMENFDDYIIISNDDVVFWPDTIEKIMKDVNEHPECIFIYPATESAHNNMFSMFLLRKEAWKKLGPFDESFYPAYFEDNDYHRRMILADMNTVKLAESGYTHVGSATLKSYTTQRDFDQHNQNFTINQQYYIEKWGGKVGEETYTIPFNGEPQ
jgi:GT2 family glycosyltransferase